MGTLTTGRKRSHDFDSLNCKTPALSSHSLKKTRFFTSSNQIHNSPRQEPRALISRYRQYPDPKPPCKREPLAPVRQSRFGSYLNSKSSGFYLFSRDKFNLPSGMGNFLGKRSKVTKEAPSKSLRFDEKDEVIEIKDDRVFESNDDDEVVEVVNVEEMEPSGNSGIEGDDMVVDEKEHDWNHRGNDKDVEELEMLDGKVVNGHYGSSSSSVMTNVSNGHLRAQSTEKTPLALIHLGEESANMGLNAYKTLFSEAQRNYPHLEPLQFQIEFNEKKWEALQQSRPRRKVEAEVEVEVEVEADAEALVDEFKKEEAFKPLTQDEENQVTHAFSNPKRRIVLVTHKSSNIDITGELLRCLRPGMWLNDEVINLYLELLKEREKRDPGKFLKCHFFNTFFYKKLTSGNGYNFQSVRRWTSQKKLGYCLWDCDKIFVPIHKNIHWCLAIINKKEQKFQYLDSLGGGDSHVLNILAKYFVDEVKEKSGKDIDVSSWTHENVEGLPEQMNGYDCGVFMIKYADFYSRGIGLCFHQENMPYFRQRTAKEILQLKAE